MEMLKYTRIDIQLAIQMSESRYIKTSFKIREDIFFKSKLLAEARGVTFTEILNDALESYVKTHEEEIKQRLSQILK